MLVNWPRKLPKPRQIASGALILIIGYQTMPRGGYRPGLVARGRVRLGFVALGQVLWHRAKIVRRSIPKRTRIAMSFVTFAWLLARSNRISARTLDSFSSSFSCFHNSAGTCEGNKIFLDFQSSGIGSVTQNGSNISTRQIFQTRNSAPSSFTRRY